MLESVETWVMGHEILVGTALALVYDIVRKLLPTKNVAGFFADLGRLANLLHLVSTKVVPVPDVRKPS